jgi:spoIIIJ-associated protein
MSDAAGAPNDAGADPALPADPSARAALVVERTLDALELGGRVVVEEDDEEIVVDVEDEDDPALLIGKHGATIDALGHVAARIAFHGHESERKRVIVDVAGYRERRRGALERAADRAAEDAVSFGRDVELDPMTAYERRVVHNHLKERGDVETHSEGEEPDRRLVVSPRRGGSAAL